MGLKTRLLWQPGFLFFRGLFLTSSSNSDIFFECLSGRILILDGAMGTMIQGHKLSRERYHGSHFHDHQCDQSGNNDLLTLTQPGIIAGIHDGFLEAGADIIETNTFNSNSVSMA